MSRCASPDDVDRLVSLNFIISQFLDLLAIIVTFYASFFAIQVVLKKSIFELSTKILLLQVILYANLHQISYGLEAIILLYKSFFLRDEICEILVPESRCAPYLEVLMTGISGMIYGQTGLMLERAFATFSSNYTKRKGRLVGCSLSVAVFFCSAFTGRLLLWDDPLDDDVFGCFVIPKKSAVRSNRYFLVCTCLCLSNAAASLYISNYNKRFEYETRFLVGIRFQKRQCIDSTRTICFLTLAQFVAMFIYSFGVFLMRNIRLSVSTATFNLFIVWLYTVPFIAMLFPLLLTYRIRATHANRVTIINEITKTRQTQEDHIKEINRMWS